MVAEWWLSGGQPLATSGQSGCRCELFFYNYFSYIAYIARMYERQHPSCRSAYLIEWSDAFCSPHIKATPRPK